MMNPEVKAKWIAALRSGEYKQGKGELRSAENQFCCLGVLCDLQGGGSWEREGKGDSHTYVRKSDHDYELPPKSLMAEWGFDWDKVEVVIGGRSDTLYNHNDSGSTFAEIANAIEAQL